MCKSASSLLRMSGERIMKLAEELYQGGWISYPRTETDAYDPGMDLRVRAKLRALMTVTRLHDLSCAKLFSSSHAQLKALCYAR